MLTFLCFQKSILSVRLLENGTLLSGGLDGKLAAWDANKYFNTPLQETQVRGYQTCGAVLEKIFSRFFLKAA